ncbi:TetR/AcrR family transcriptional regulator [Streptomyces sp. NPDC059629]|uniref:TetR/AcrR family transcriptional regulator n=1 Tax=Streptomyces sp. NPDC059629 TaxID=3346889 RepID=UPI0036765F36
MATTSKASPRERLLDAAAELFYRKGVGVGTDALCRAAKVSKRSMYQLFASKDEVLAAALDRQGRTITALLRPPPEAQMTPRDRLLYVFERLEEETASTDYLGCPHLVTQIELKDPGHVASVVSARNKQQLADFFRAEAEQAGADDPETLARQLMLVYDGASARAGIKADALNGLAVDAAKALLHAAGIPVEAHQDASDSIHPATR